MTQQRRLRGEFKKALLGSVFTTTIAVTAGAAYAQDADSEAAARSRGSVTDTIVVTATKREENAQDVGIALTAFSGEQMDTLGIRNAAEIEQITPNMSLDRPYGAKGFNTQITIRGIGQPDFGDNTESTVTSYVDGFYLISQGTSDFLLHDIQRVEVARGPQGTVQGRNSTAGSINYYTNKPGDEFDAGARISGGRFNYIDADAFVNIPLNETLALRISGAHQSNDGYIKNINPNRLFDAAGESEFNAARAAIRYQPNDRLTIDFRGDWGQMGPAAAQPEQSLQIGLSLDGTQTVIAPTDALGFSEANVGAADKSVINEGGPNFISNRITHFGGEINYEASENLDLVLLGGYMKSHKTSGEDCDDNVREWCLFSNDAYQSNWMVEARADFSSSNDRIRGIVGFNYLSQNIDSTAVTPLFWDAQTSNLIGLGGDLLTFIFNDQQDLTSWAAFSQWEFDLTDQLTFIGGLRYTQDRKVFDAFFAQAVLAAPLPIPRTIDDFLALGDQVRAQSTPAGQTIFNRATVGDLAVIDDGVINANAQINWTPIDDVLVYAAYRRGVKSGGFITGNVGPGYPAATRPYGAETNNAYEVGLKSRVMGGNALLNGAVFYYDYNDLQANSLIGITNAITNNDTTVYGGEVELAASPIEGLDLSIAAGYVHSKVQDVTNAQGITADRELPLAPKYTFNATLKYETPAPFGIDGSVWAQGNVRTQGARWRDALNNPSVQLEAFTIANAQVGYRFPSENVAVYAWMRNAFNSRHEVTTVDLISLGGTGEVAYEAPQWWGVTLELSY